MGNPIAKKLPRFSKHRGFVQCYDTQDKDKEKLKSFLKLELKKYNNLPLKNPVSINFIFYVPPTASKYLQNLWYPLLCMSKPDIDNYIKFYLDVLNEIAWTDDKQIFYISAVKRYDLQPRTEITMHEINDPTTQDVYDIQDVFLPEEFTQFLKDCNSIANPPDHKSKITDDLDYQASFIKKFIKKYLPKFKILDRKYKKTPGEGKTLC